MLEFLWGDKMVCVYVSNIKDLPDPLEFPKSMDGLSEKRKEKICRCMYPKDRKQSLGAGLLLNKVLSLHGVLADDIVSGENGKPQIQGICFNLSHSEDMVICTVSEKPVGCDVEKIKEINLKIADRFFSKKEVEYLKTFDEKNRTDVFFRLWTMKESYIKMTGEGMRLSLDQFEIIFDEDVKVFRNGQRCACFIKEYELPGYKLSVCAEEKEFVPIRSVVFEDKSHV